MHSTGEWKYELYKKFQNIKCKGWKAQLHKTAFAEIFYEVWKYINDICFGNTLSNTTISFEKINIIMRHLISSFIFYTHKIL